MRTGLDQLADANVTSRLRGTRFGLLAHPASVDRNLVHISSILEKLGLLPSIVFGPEHGYGGEAQDMIRVDHATDARGTRVVSLYGDEFDDLMPHEDDLRGLDVLLIDMQDIGSRYYTFVWTALLALRKASAMGIRTIVLDRPNPIGSKLIEGRLHDDEKYCSFVGLVPTPIRHALTLGELLQWRSRVENLDGLDVVPVLGLDPASEGEDWDREFVMTSPNMPTAETARVYPGGCLLEGTNLSEGRGTTRPFEVFGAPFVDGRALADALRASRLPGFAARPLHFLPTFHKFAGKLCGGVQIHVTDRRLFRPVATYVAAIALIAQKSPEHFRFRTEKYEFVSDIPAFDLLTGGEKARLGILAGDDPFEIATFVSRVDANWRTKAVAP